MFLNLLELAKVFLGSFPNGFDIFWENILAFIVEHWLPGASDKRSDDLKLPNFQFLRLFGFAISEHNCQKPAAVLVSAEDA